jgi:hypothetical protein
MPRNSDESRCRGSNLAAPARGGEQALSVICSVCGEEHDAGEPRRQFAFRLRAVLACGCVICFEHGVKRLCPEHAAIEVPEYEFRRSCRDCGIDVFDRGHWYMVTDRVWALAARGSLDGFLCLDCLADRLGRRLELLDFTMAPTNRSDHTRWAILEAVTGQWRGGRCR